MSYEHLADSGVQVFSGFRSDLQKLVTRTSRALINVTSPGIDSAITESLERLARVIESPHCQLCRFHGRVPTRMTTTHEWSAGHAGDGQPLFDHVPTTVFPWLCEPLQSNQLVRARSLDHVPIQGQKAAAMLRSRGCRSLIAAPLTAGGVVWGYLGCAPREASEVWNMDNTDLVQMFGELLVCATQRQESVDALSRSEERWHSIASTAYDLIAVVDDEGTIQHIARSVPEFAAQEFAGASVYDFVYPESRKEMRNCIKRVLETEDYVTFEHRAAGPMGKPTWFSTCGGPYRQNGRVVGVSLFSTVIDDRKHAEERARKLHDQLAHAQRLGLLGMMSTEIAHQLHQPLQVIASNVNGCRNLLVNRETSWDEIDGALDRAAVATRDAGRIIQGIRDFVRRKTVEPQVTDIESIVDDALRLAEPVLVREKVVCRRKLESGLPMVCVDPIQITHVILNLVVNAAEAVAEARLRPGVVQVQIRRSGSEFVEIVVSDNGPGIERDVLKDIFEHFYTTKQGGLGIGLAISRDFVEAHGGTIRVRSKSGEGSVFLVTLRITPDFGSDTAEFDVIPASPQNPEYQG